MKYDLYRVGLGLFVLVNIMMWICTLINVSRADPSSGGWGTFSALISLITGCAVFVIGEYTT